MARTPKSRQKKNQSATSASQSEPAELPLPTLSLEEEKERLDLERKVERAFFIAGMALMNLRDQRLYRSTHATFEEYCRERFNFTRQAANYLIAGASVFEVLTTNGCQKLPTSERQVRPISNLSESEQVDCWQQAVTAAGNRVPSGRIVKDVVQRLKNKIPAPMPFQVGEVCSLIVKDNAELRGKGGCWCIVSEVHEFTCTVYTWDNQYLVRPEHLNSLEYGEIQCQQMENISLRMSLLYETENLDEAALWILNGLARIKRPTLTPLEEKLLTLLELEYGTESKTRLIELLEP